MTMLNIIGLSNKSDQVTNRIFKYVVFTIVISWSPIIANYLIIFLCDLPVTNFIIYKSEICFMTIILVANNLKDLSESLILKRGKMLFNILYSINVVNIFCCILFFASYNSLKLSGINKSEPELRQFWFVIATYILAAIMGLGVQIGGGIDEIKCSGRRKIV